VYSKAATLCDTFALVLVGALMGGLLAHPVDGHAEENVLGAYRGAKTTVYPDWFKDSFLEFADDIAEAAENGRRVLIIFHQDNCPYCNALVERNLSQKQIEEKVRENFDVIAVNMWGDRDVVTVEGESFSEKDFARALRVQFTPTIVIFDEQGNVALRLNGYLPPERFEAAIDYGAGRMESQMTYNQYLSEAATSAPSGQITMEDFCTTPPADLSTADQAERPIAVFFEQKQCPNCDVLHHHVLSDPPTRAIAEKFRCFQLDMWSLEEVTTPVGEVLTVRKWATKLDVKYAPTIVLFDRAGREVIRSEAYFKTFHTQSILDYVYSGAHLEEPEFQRYMTERANRIRAAGTDVDIWK
jgi:thioredoxin-related protein